MLPRPQEGYRTAIGGKKRRQTSHRRGYSLARFQRWSVKPQPRWSLNLHALFDLCQRPRAFAACFCSATASGGGGPSPMAQRLTVWLFPTTRKFLLRTTFTDRCSVSRSAATGKEDTGSGGGAGGGTSHSMLIALDPQPGHCIRALRRSSRQSWPRTAGGDQHGPVCLPHLRTQ